MIKYFIYRKKCLEEFKDKFEVSLILLRQRKLHSNTSKYGSIVCIKTETRYGHRHNDMYKYKPINMLKDVGILVVHIGREVNVFFFVL